MNALRWIVIYALNLASLVLLGRVVSSWLDPQAGHPLSRLLVRVTEPVLAPVRRLLPRTGPVDLSPLIVFLVLTVLARMLLWL